LFVITFTPSKPGVNGKIQWRIDNVVIREEVGGHVNYLDNTVRIHSAVWKTGPTGWGAYGNYPLANTTKADIQYIKFRKKLPGSWTVLNNWTFANQSSLTTWMLSNWTFSGFQGSYTPANAKVSNGILSLNLTKR
jgi:hypothetical protein